MQSSPRVFLNMDYFKDLGSYSKIPLYDFPTLYSALGLQKDSLKKLDINSLDKLVNSDQVTGEHLYLGHLSGFKSLTSLALPAFTLVSRENSKPDSKVTTELSTRTILLPISTSVVAIYLISGEPRHRKR